MTGLFTPTPRHADEGRECDPTYRLDEYIAEAKWEQLQREWVG
jgi:hypothetical protein